MLKQRVVLTGGPGAGKTTLIEALRERGFAVASESARAIIEARMKDGLAPRPAPREFAQEILRQDIEKYLQHANESGPSFYDRSLIEALGMVNELDPFADHALKSLLAEYPFHHEVFVLPPWEDIFLNDSARDQSFTEAARVHVLVTRWYRHCGYEIVEVPRTAVAERCEHVLGVLAAGDA